MNGVLKYWNRGAQELYGWTAEEAIGNVTHDLLKTIFPIGNRGGSHAYGPLGRRACTDQKGRPADYSGEPLVLAARRDGLSGSVS